MTNKQSLMQEENPLEYSRQLKEQAESARDKMNEILISASESIPKAAWPDEKSPVVGDPGFSSAFLNNWQGSLFKLAEARDLMEKALKHY